MPETTADRVIRVITSTQKLAVDRVQLDSTFRDLAIDSLDGLNIIFALEEEFAIEVPDDAGRAFRSVGEVVAGVEQLLAAGHSGKRS